MATTTPILGNSLILYLNGVAVAYSRECSFSVSIDEIDITSKDSAKAYAMLPGTVKATISHSGLHSVVNASGWLTTAKAGTALAWKFTTAVSGDKYYSGATAYIVSHDETGPYNAEATVSANLAVSGTWAITTKT